LHGIDSSSQEFTSWNANYGGLFNIERPDLNKEHHELLHFDKNRDELEEDEKSIKLEEEDEDEKSIENGDVVD
jgi:pyoverdine/dityrosine biosynthesis protein Dit1